MRILAAFMLAAATAFITPAAARTLELRADALQSPVATASGLHIRLDTGAAMSGGRLQVDVDVLDAVGFGYGFRKLHWECPLVRGAQGTWSCAGDVRAGHAKPMRLALAITPASTAMRLSDGTSAVGAQRMAKTPDAIRLVFEQVPTAWLQAYVATLWNELRLQKGQLDGQLDIRSAAKSGVHVQGPLRLRGLSLETSDGGIAAGAVDADAKLDFSQLAGQRSLAVDASLQGGELLAGGFYAALPKTPITASLRGRRVRDGDWLLSSLAWNDGAVLAAHGSAAWSPAQGLHALDLRLQSGDLGVAHDRYLTGWLDPAGFAGLRLSGGMQAGLARDANGWRSVQLRLQHVDAADGKQRFSVHGLDGDLRWTSDAETVDSALRWSDGVLGGMALGPASLALRSQSRHVALSAPVGIPMLGGTLRLDHFDLAPPDAAAGTRFGFGISLVKMQVAEVARLLGWPAFGGTLDGNLPSAHYADGILGFDGALQAQVFGGRLSVNRLAMERAFGDDPSVSADVDIDGFDLKALTGVFGFGQISGRLDGSIRDLRLLDGSPVAFDAQLHSDDAAPDRRRISQRAVADLSSVGGGGLGAGLQSQALRLFQDFGYARIGLSCRLANDVCRMDGIPGQGTGSAGAGYTIVEGSGLPHISVIGFERQVDWPTLVARLKAATQGDIVIK